MTQTPPLSLAANHVEFPQGSALRSMSIRPSADGASYRIHVTPDTSVPAQAFQQIMNRVHDRVWAMAVHPPVPRRTGQGVPGYVDIPAPTSMPLQEDGSYLTAAMPADKAPAALALMIGALNRSIDTPTDGTGITAPLLNDENTKLALDTFNLHTVLQQIKRSLPPIDSQHAR